MPTIQKSQKLRDVCYDIRGPVLQQAIRMEENGERILKLNIGNLATFGFEPPQEIVQDVMRNIHDAAGYSNSKGLFSARRAVAHYAQQKNIPAVTVEDIFLGNGVSELIHISTSALLNPGDEVLLPTPDYPLWTASTVLSGGVAKHYICDETNQWLPDVDNIRSLITSRTRALVVINPNNPTGTVYPRSVLLELVEIARQHNLVIMADEVYDKVLYDGAEHISIASLADDVLCLTMNGLSKNYRACGYRASWMIISGARENAKDFLEGLNMLASMRLCANVMGQLAIQTALGGYQSIEDLVEPHSGRLWKQRELAYRLITEIPGVTCYKPQAALYLFPKLDPACYPIKSDVEFAYQLLESEKLLVVQGSGFNWIDQQHFRVVFLPHADELTDAIERLSRFLAKYAQNNKRT